MWPLQKLGDVITLEYGKPLPKEERVANGEHPVYGANGEKCRTNTPYYRKKSIIVGRKGSAGEVNLTEEAFWPLDVTYFVKFDESRHDLMFIFHVLKSLNLQNLAKGVKPGINRNDVYALEFSFPPLPEQKRVVAILDEAFEGIDAAIANTQASLAAARELFDSYLGRVFNNPDESWIKDKLNNNVRFIDYRGKTPPKVEKGIRLITAKNVKMGFIKTDPEEFIEPSAYDDWMTRGFPQMGNVLFTTEAPLGNVAQLDTSETVVIGQRLITMQPDPSVLSEKFLKYLLMSHPIQKEILSMATGATVLGIKAKLLKQLPIFYPRSIEDQNKIAANIEDVEKCSDRLAALSQQKLDALYELKQSILAKAFRGELTQEEIAA